MRCIIRTRFIGSGLLTGLAILSAVFNVYGQNNAEVGLPFVTNYPATVYKGVPQVWCAEQDSTGVMYFGVQAGMIEYDGAKWQRIKLDDAAIVRAFCKNKAGTIYYGSYGDFGYLAKDSLGHTVGRSLLANIPAESRDFLDIWSIYSTGESLYFQSREYIFQVSDKGTNANAKRSVKTWKAKSKFIYSFYLDGQYFVHQQGLGLYKMVNDSLEFIPGSAVLGNERMQVMLPYKGNGNQHEYLCGLFFSGLYLYDGQTFKPFQTKADPILKSGSLLYRGLQLDNGNYALATAGGGLIIIDERGELIQQINNQVGLQDENVYSVFLDNKKTLWLGLENGISKLNINSPLSQFALQSGLRTGALTVMRANGIIYTGTANGLYRYNLETRKFEQVNEIKQTQIFSTLLDGKTFIIATDGVYAIRDRKVEPIKRSISGDFSTTNLYIPKHYPNLLLTCGSYGLGIFQRKIQGNTDPGNWEFKGLVPGIPDQIWTLSENKDGTFWCGTQSGDLYKLSLSFDQEGHVALDKSSVGAFTFPGAVGSMFAVDDISYFVSDSAFYTFNDASKTFHIDTTFGTFPKGGGSVEQVAQADSSGRVWLRVGKETILAIPKPGGGYQLTHPPLNTINETTIQAFYPENTGVVWICATSGLIRYDQNLATNKDLSFNTVLRHVKAGKDVLNPFVLEAGKSIPSVSHASNTLRFEYAAPFFEQEDKTEFQTWLEGFEPKWSDFDNNFYKEYTNLPPGKYHFHVRGKNIFNQIGKEAIYSFEILPPWYATWWAYLIYAVLIIAIIYALIRWRTKQLHAKQRELEKTVALRTAELSHRLEELAVINSVQEGLVAQMNMGAIYDLVGEKIRNIFGSEIVDIVTYDPDDNVIQDGYAYEKGDRTLLGPRTPTGVREYIIKNKQAVVINDELEKQIAFYNSPVTYGETPKSAVFVPMIAAGEVTGIISLQNLEKEHAFSDSDVNLLTTLANSMSVALKSARLIP